MIKNYMEILVDQVYNNIPCECDKCKDDIKSIALNSLEPKYFTSCASEAEIKAFLLDRQRHITVIARLTEAKKMLCNNCNKK